MKKLIFLSLAVYIIGFVSCSQEHKHENEGQSAEKPETHEHEGKAHSHSDYEVLLPEEGDKWEANVETTEGINAMSQKVQDFIDGKSTNPEYENLKEELEGDFQMIFQKCTMKGEAHEQLHNYLVPMKYMIEGLGSKDEGLAKEKVGELQDHLAEYSNYFK